MKRTRAVVGFEGQPPATRSATRLRQRAQRITDRLLALGLGIEGVCLFGSVARGDATEWSDIDLLVIGADRSLTPSAILRRLPATLRRRLSILYYPTPAFRRHYRERALFIAHIRQQGHPLYDPRGLLKRMLERPFVPRVDVAKGLTLYRKQLEPYRDVRRFRGNYLFCLAHLYSIGKGVVMLALAQDGVLEFNRDHAFEVFAATHRAARRDVAALTVLRPFYALVNGREPERLPFSYRTAVTPVRRAVAAIDRLAARVEGS